MGEMFQELRRRNIFRVAAAYVVMGWILLQVTGLVVPGFDLPAWTFPFVTFVLVIGFPFVLFFAWAFELTPEGLRRTAEVDPQQSAAMRTGRKLDFIIIGIMSLALLFLVIDRLFLPGTADTAAPSGTAVSSIAVLPFVNMSNDPDQVYFSDGISEEILNVLSQIPDLHVTSRSSAFQYRGDNIHIPTVAQQLGVANILEGSVRRSGTRIRITAQLIDASTDRHLWAKTYDRELTDIFAVQDEISQAIVEALHVQLGVEAPSVPKAQEADVEAYRLYLLGRHSFEQRTVEALNEALDLFDQAIAIDPDYAPAHSGKADTYMLLGVYGGLAMAEAVASAEPLVERALELDPVLADAHASRGVVLSNSLRLDAAMLAYDRAIEINPNLARAWYWKGGLLNYTGDAYGAGQCFRRAYVLDPLSPTVLGFLVWNKLQFGEFTEAEDLLKRLQATPPGAGGGVSNAILFVPMIQGDWALAYSGFKGGKEDLNEADELLLAIALVTLNGFDPETTRLSQVNRIHVNSYHNPEEAWRDYQALPEAKKAIPLLQRNVAFGISHVGRYAEVVGLLESLPNFVETFPGPLFTTPLPKYFSAPFLVLARQKTGDEAGANRLLKVIETRIAVMKAQGEMSTLPFLEAEVHALKGEDDKVIAALERSHLEGSLYWFELNFPFFETVRDREDFQAIVRSVDARVNEERAKLGWEPVE